MPRGFNGFDQEWLNRYRKVHARASVPAPDVEPDTCPEPARKDAPQAIDTPVRIHVHHIRKRLADLDGLSVKAMLDGIVMAGILADDRPEIVTAITTTQQRIGKD